MDNFQITCLCLLGVITLSFVGFLVLFYKSIVRHQASTDQQTDLLGRLIEVESAIKSALPAIERNTGAAHVQLVENLPLTAKSVSEIAGIMATRLPTLQESMHATERSSREISGATIQAAETLEAIQKSIMLIQRNSDESLNVAGNAVKVLGASQEVLETLGKTHSAEAVDGRLCTLSETIRTNTSIIQNDLQRATAEVTELRKDLSSAVKF